MATKWHIHIPADHPIALTHRPGPMSPSSVVPPSISPHSTHRRESSGGSSSTKASLLLLKMASQDSSSSRKATATRSPLPSSGTRPPLHYLSSLNACESRKPPGASRLDETDGYISFPDFEEFHNGRSEPRQEPRRGISRANNPTT